MGGSSISLAEWVANVVFVATLRMHGQDSTRFDVDKLLELEFKLLLQAPGGRFANGLITRQYKPGQDIVVKVDVTANHKGYFTFKLCQNNNTAQDPRQDCFDK